MLDILIGRRRHGGIASREKLPDLGEEGGVRRCHHDEDTNSREQRLRIGYFNVYASELLAQPLSRMRREAPRAQVELVDLPPRCWRMRFRPARLIWRCSDVEPTTARRFETRALAIVPMLLALPTGDPLAKHRRLALAQLRDTPFIGYTEKEFPGRPALLQRACRAAGFEPRIIRRVDSLMSMLLAVGTGEGAGFGAEYLKCMPHNGVVFRR